MGEFINTEFSCAAADKLRDGEGKWHVKRLLQATGR